MAVESDNNSGYTEALMVGDYEPEHSEIAYKKEIQLAGALTIKNLPVNFKGDKIISFIEVEDLYIHGANGCVKVLHGGVGKNYVVLNFRTNAGAGIYMRLTIWVKK